jgi:glycosyltransferase involved in cell wall biosynthesis
LTPVYHLNLQRQMGGGEIYARFLHQALRVLGRAPRLICAPGADFWEALGIPAAERQPLIAPAALPTALPSGASIILHGAQDTALSAALAARGPLAAIAHMPIYRRSAEGFRPCHRVFAVSGYVRDTLHAAGITQTHDEPLLGVADLNPRATSDGRLLRRSRYDWDRRKLRDRLLGISEPLWSAWQPRPAYCRRPGLTLGVVSRLTPIKQFPELFRALLPTLLARPDVQLEIFGAGGYASVRDLRRVLAPLGGRVRWWGRQPDVRTVYAQLDYLLTGLPEYEALGLNAIEAQVAGTPVLAVRAPPFTETVSAGQGGFFYTDPRQDAGSDFAALLARLRHTPRPDPASAQDFLQRFSMDAFTARLARALAALESPPSPVHD